MPRELGVVPKLASLLLLLLLLLLLCCALTQYL
jgi:hypothetical protein